MSEETPIVEEEQDNPEDGDPAMLPLIEFKKYINPIHPYCTNWPVGKKLKNENI